MKYKKVKAKFNYTYMGLILFMILIICGLLIGVYAKPDIRLFFIGFILFVIYGIHTITSNFKFVRLSHNNIKVGIYKTYQYEDITEVQLYTTIYSTYFFISYPEQGLTLKFKNGDEISLKENYYRNIWQIRWYLEQRALLDEEVPSFNYRTNFSDVTPTNKTSQIPVYITFFRILFSISCLSFIALIATKIIHDDFDIGFIFINFSVLFFYVIFGANMYYLESSPDYIIIKNLIFPGSGLTIPINHIESIKRKKQGGGRSVHTFLIIHTIYHKDFTFGIEFSGIERTLNGIDQIKKQRIRFIDYL